MEKNMKKSLIISIYDSAYYWSIKIIINEKEFLIDRDDYELNDSIMYREDFAELLELVNNNHSLGEFFENNYKGYEITICENGCIDNWFNKERGKENGKQN